MIKRYLILTCLVLTIFLASAQNTEQDSTAVLPDTDLAIDTSIDYDELFSEMELFLDSILAPRSFFLANLSFNNGYFYSFNRTTNRIEMRESYIMSPGLGYYSKSGLGLTISGNAVNDGQQLNLYQMSISPSFDYLKNRKLAAGISYMRYITKESLPFYISPLQNEIYGYFVWRKSWLQPGINVNYGWGNKTEYRKREILYRKLVANAVARGTIRVIDTVSVLITNKQSIVDFTTAASLRHDFYWLNIFSDKDHIRVSPMLSLNAGTQRFGYNQTTGTYTGVTRATLAYNTGTKSISMVEKFKLLSLSMYLRTEYSIGKFFIQPQVIVDYYFPANDDNLTTMFSLNTGFMF
ncbi:MAG: hypothetical protein JNK14_00605 [Chitinophagaceae bacterium]|nr:hypothetical protein [Chitinophagaceae bacterium]